MIYDETACYHFVLEMLRQVIMQSDWGKCKVAISAQHYLDSDDFKLWKILLRLYIINTPEKRELLIYPTEPRWANTIRAHRRKDHKYIPVMDPRYIRNYQEAMDD